MTDATSSNTTYVIDHWQRDGHCAIEEMHHYAENPDGGPDLHYCPTGFLWCVTHGELAGTADGTGLCHLWGEAAA